MDSSLFLTGLLLGMGAIVAKNQFFSATPTTTDNTTADATNADKVQDSKKKVKTYSLKEVKKHSTKEDAWTIINGKVYDITEWIPNHPGGQIIMEIVGKDGSEFFNRHIQGITYSKDKPKGFKGKTPQEIIKKFYIGDLK